jgi:hypothetical protein
MAALLEEHPHIIALAHTADYTNRAYWSELYYWLNDHFETTTTSSGRLLPIIPARGNHDLDVGFEEKFWWPDRENDYYFTTHLSSQVALITLNSTISRGAPSRRPTTCCSPRLFRQPQAWSLRPSSTSERCRTGGSIFPSATGA